MTRWSLVEVDVLHLKLRLQAGAKDQRFAAIAAEGNVIAVMQFGGFDADAIDEGSVGGLVGQLDPVLFDRKLRVHGGHGGVFHHHLAARRIAADHQALVRYVLALYRELVNDQVNVGAGHEIGELDGHGAARGAIRLLRGGNIRLADHGGVRRGHPPHRCPTFRAAAAAGAGTNDSRRNRCLPPAPKETSSLGFRTASLNPHFVDERSVGGIAVAKHHLAGFVQAHPGMLAGDLVIRQDDLAFGLVAADDKTLWR